MMQGQDRADEPEQQQANDIVQDISNIYSVQSTKISTKISVDLGGLAEIRSRTTASVETKLSALITRLDNVEN